jgi:hypothetical protein
MNKQIYNKLKSPDNVPVTTVHSSEWLWNVVRMDGKTTVQKLPEGKPGGGRKKVSPTLRWLDDDELDLRNMGVKRRTTAFDRTEWPSIMMEAKNKFKGLLH